MLSIRGLAAAARDEVHVEALVNVVIQQLLLQGREAHLLHLGTAHLVLLFLSRSRGRVSLDARQQVVNAGEVVRVVLQRRVEVSIEGDR